MPVMQRYTPVVQAEADDGSSEGSLIGDDEKRMGLSTITKRGVSLDFGENARPLAPLPYGPLQYKTLLIASWILFALLITSIGFTTLTLNILYPYGIAGGSEKAIVLASYSAQNTSWLNEIPPNWKVYQYALDDPNPDTDLTVPRNQGREAMAYLTFIINHYTHLPKYTIFLHGHNRSWHQTEPVAWKIRALNLPLLDTEGYINFRCGLKPGCSNDTILGASHPEPRSHPLVRQMMPAFWNTMFRLQHGDWDYGAYPPELGQPCCAQFAVTREAILRNSIEFYESYRRPMTRDVYEYKGIFGDLWDGYRMGILYEHVWHVVFGKQPLWCPAPEMCRKVFFQDKIVCSNYTGDFEHSAGWEGIECSNRWDGGRKMVGMGSDEERNLREPQLDSYGGWDGGLIEETRLEELRVAEERVEELKLGRTGKPRVLPGVVEGQDHRKQGEATTELATIAHEGIGRPAIAHVASDLSNGGQDASQAAGGSMNTGLGDAKQTKESTVPRLGSEEIAAAPASGKVHP